MRRPITVLAAAALLAVPLTACDEDGGPAPAEVSPASVDTTAEPSPEPAEPLTAEDFDPALFDETSIDVDNQWFPLVPGTRFVFEGEAFDEDNGERIERKVIFTVTDLVKEIGGVRSVVIWDRDYDDDELIEAEIAFFAQDMQGNVWHLGQYPEEYDEGEFDKAPGWIHGAKGATAGIAMHADPQPGLPDYAQGFAPPPINWDDRGRVWKTGQEYCVPVQCYEDVLVIEEFEPGIEGAFQLKYYAPGVGNVGVGWRGPEEEEKETLELVEYVHLSTNGIEEARDEASYLDGRAHEIKPQVYGGVPRAEVR